MNRKSYSLALLACFFFFVSLAFAAAPAPRDPIYIRIENGWKGLYALEDEYATYSFQGKEIKLQDAYHALLTPQLGLMVTFADKTQFGGGGDLLDSYLQWELDYWRKHAAKIESAPRNDLSGARSDLRVNEMRLYSSEGKQMKVYTMALASSAGVFVLSISPADSSIDPLVREIANSFVLVHRKLDGQELTRIRTELQARQ